MIGLALCVATVLGADDVDFRREILPILSDQCFQCHGPDAKQRQAGLRLDSRDAALAPAESGRAAIVAGKPDESALVARILSPDPSERMPPADSNKTLTDAQKVLLRKWIAAGAKYEQHWAFVAPVAAAEPTVRNEAWSRHAIDRFILAQLEREGLAPRDEASRDTLIRRVAFVLTGLPPTPAEAARFASDASPHAYEAMVQRYLDSPRYGEEMARHWLDVARYADTHGMHLDNEREMWAYRDWVVRSLNENQPFDRFTVDQLAGDLLPDPTLDQRIATGFNRCNVTTGEGGSIEAEFLYRYAVERTSTVIQAWMGLTGGCAVCHDHKYDPLSTREFYSLYAFFYNAADPGLDRNIRNTEPFLSLAAADQRAELTRLKQAESAALAALEQIAATAASDDPATVVTLPPRPIHDILLDDLFPLGARVTSSSRNPSTWIDNRQIGGTLGRRALRQAGAVLYQDKVENFAESWAVPPKGTISVAVHLDPFEPPLAIMVELATSQGVRRAIWGDAERLGTGTVGTSERKRIGDLPAAGQWARLEIPAEAIELANGETIRSFTLAQYGGIVCWDGLTLRGELAPSQDPRVSFIAWWKDRTGVEVSGVPDELKATLRSGPDNNPTDEQRRKLEAFHRAFVQREGPPELREARAAWQAATAARATMEESIPGTFMFRDLDKPRESFVMLRGQYDRPGEKVQPDVPAVFPRLNVAAGSEASARGSAAPAGTPTRLDLARWLVAPEHPLTARVAVNRLWQQVFGTGLVKTSDDFGTRGEPPSHAELLDWLAVRYRESGWDTKEMMRLLLTSATFRQEATVVPEILKRDPHNRLLARGPRLRLDAEQVRDNALFVSGLLNLQMGGRGVRPYQPPNIWEPVGYSDSNTRHYLQDHGDLLYRRSIYCFLKRTAPPPFMSNFDGPNREQFCSRRERTNTPLQALQLLNDIQHFEAARALGERMIAEGGNVTDDRIRYGFRAVLTRDATEDELEVLRSTLDKYVGRYRRDEAAAARVIGFGESRPKTQSPPAELAAYTLLANLILNLDEAVTR